VRYGKRKVEKKSAYDYEQGSINVSHEQAGNTTKQNLPSTTKEATTCSQEKLNNEERRKGNKRTPAVPYLEAFEAIVYPTTEQTVKIGKVLKDGWHEEDQELLSVLKANHKALALLRRAIDSGDCYFPAPEHFFDAHYLPVGDWKQAAILLALEVRFLQRESDFDGAARDIIRGVKFWQDCTRERGFLGELFGRAVLRVPLDLLQSEILEKTTDIRFLNAIHSSLSMLDYDQSTIQKSLDVEKAIIDRAYEKYCEDEEWRERYHKQAGGMSVEDMVKFGVRADRCYREISSALDVSFRRGVEKAVQMRKNLEEEDEKEASHYFVLTHYEGYETVLKTKGYQLAQYSMIQAGVALELYKARHGHYPESLQQLVPGCFLQRVPIDPFSGKPIIYTNSGNEWTLYSFGSDLDDDKAQEKSENPMDDGDIVLGKDQK
jgi:hypothetical protein